MDLGVFSRIKYMDYIEELMKEDEMSGMNFQLLLEVATQKWERDRDVSSKDRLDEYFKNMKLSKGEG